MDLLSPSAKMIADSVSESGNRVSTFEVICHRFVLAEFNTHRVFSRNSASSRAIPVARQLDRVNDNMAYPVSWPAEQKGMQGGDELSSEDIDDARVFWERARDAAVAEAKSLISVGVHKSVVNRLLEPFQFHTIVVTSTAWDNFFKQRCSPLAQPEIRVVAESMREIYEASSPTLLLDGEWHLPYIQPEDYDIEVGEDLIKISAARCAAVSYMNQGKIDQKADLARYEKLVSAVPMHGSPLEHPCTPNEDNWQEVEVERHIGRHSDVVLSKMLILPKYGNLLGFHQHRFDVEVEIDYQAFA